eukprot:GHVQ01003338.1.p1 GENE.GHVQ01003338.1~~GHVQ01003338.1.p1  ORF type:complete len:330 (-),score=31.12 GHVQ01003338.1:10-999(-)
MFNNKSWFSSLHECEKPTNVTSSNGSVNAAQSRGTVEFCVETVCGKKLSVSLEALFVPSNTRNLLSVNSLRSNGHKLVIEEECILVLNTGDHVPVKQHDRMFLLNVSVDDSVMCTQADSSNLWHRRLTHINHNYVVDTQKAVTGMNALGKQIDRHCDICTTSKATKQAVNKVVRNEQRATYVWERVYVDLCGPLQRSVGDKQYILGVVDEYSKYTTVYFLGCKSEALDKLNEYILSVAKPSIIRSDNGGELHSKQFTEFCKQKRISHEFTAPYSPQQNAVVERRWTSLLEGTRCLLHESGLSKGLWVRDLDTVVYVRSRTMCKGPYYSI